MTFPQKGNKKVVCQQGDPLGKVCSKAGVRIKFDCKNGRCGTCQVRLNGRSAAKICQGATVPGGATKKLAITLGIMVDPVICLGDGHSYERKAAQKVWWCMMT